jgi:hypothetical protein
MPHSSPVSFTTFNRVIMALCNYHIKFRMLVSKLSSLPLKLWEKPVRCRPIGWKKPELFVTLSPIMYTLTMFLGWVWNYFLRFMYKAMFLQTEKNKLHKQLVKSDMYQNVIFDLFRKDSYRFDLNSLCQNRKRCWLIWLWLQKVPQQFTERFNGPSRWHLILLPNSMKRGKRQLHLFRLVHFAALLLQQI